jgi:hypothetical protein
MKTHESQKIMKKIYAYVDESGQDTKGLVFIVSVLILERDREKINKILEEIETASGKKTAKWHKARHEFRKQYFEEILKTDILQNSIFFDSFSDTRKYIELTAFATAKAILKKTDSNYKATIFVDGLKKNEMKVFTKGIRDLKIRTKKIRGVKKDENNSFVRLVDAVCGMVRDANQGNIWAEEILAKFKRKDILKEL